MAEDSIMIVTNSVSGGGAERAMNLLANELANKSYSILLVALNKSGSDFVEIKCPVLDFGREENQGLTGLLKTFYKFVQCVRANKPTVIVTNCDLPELFTSFLPIRVNILVVEHCNPSWSTRKSLGQIVRRILRARSATFVAVSSHLTIWPFNSNPEGFLPNMLVPLEEIELVQAGYKVKRLIFVGRMAKLQKQPHILLEISKKLDLPVIFIGDGEERERLKVRSDSELIDAAFFEFQIDPWKMFRQGDLLVVPSAFEGDGLVVLEAIQRNIPLLVADIPDFRRFQLPDHNYCGTTLDYCDRITKFSDKLDALVISHSTKMKLVAERTADKVLRSFVHIVQGTQKSVQAKTNFN